MCKVITDYGNFCWQVTICVFTVSTNQDLLFSDKYTGTKIVCVLVNLFVRQNIFVFKKFTVSLFENGMKF